MTVERLLFRMAVEAFSKNDFEKVRAFFKDEDPSQTIKVTFQDTLRPVDDGPFSGTCLLRTISVLHLDAEVMNWTEEYFGYYGGMGSGWFVEEGDSEGPPPGLRDLFSAFGIVFPEVVVPEPDPGDEEE